MLAQDRVTVLGGFTLPPAEAYEAQPPIRTKLFRRIGDVSLYVGGFFQQSLSRKVVDVDYYIEVGGRAYGLVAGAEEPAHRSIYEELALKCAVTEPAGPRLADVNCGCGTPACAGMWARA